MSQNTVLISDQQILDQLYMTGMSAMEIQDLSYFIPLMTNEEKAQFLNEIQ